MLIRKSAVIQRIEGKKAVLLIENDQEISVFKDELSNAEVGQSFVIEILPEAEATMKKDELARELLNQLMSDAYQESTAQSD